MIMEKDCETAKKKDINRSFDKLTGKWRTRIQLDEERLWFLSIFTYEDGKLDRYSLDHEAADDSHYEFSDEESVRKALYSPGDEKLSFAEVLIRYTAAHGGNALLNKLYPYITAQYHF